MPVVGRDCSHPATWTGGGAATAWRFHFKPAGCLLIAPCSGISGTTSATPFQALRRAPRNTLIALGILGLGIGANTAMFGAVNHVLLRPMPFQPDAERLIRRPRRFRSPAPTGEPRHPFEHVEPQRHGGCAPGVTRLRRAWR